MRGAHGMMWWSAFGLLSSSCCALQLILNLFNFGCAGFNTYLGPVRPFFLAVTITLNVRMWQLAIPNLGLPSTPEHYLPSIIISTVTAVLLSLLPEIIEWRNRSSVNKEAAAAAVVASTAAAASAGTLTEVVLSLEGLGCVACTSAVRGAIQKITTGRVIASAVALEAKEARITIACDEKEARDSVVPDIIEQIESAGFEATLETVEEISETSTTASTPRSQTPRQRSLAKPE